MVGQQREERDQAELAGEMGGPQCQRDDPGSAPVGQDGGQHTGDGGDRTARDRGTEVDPQVVVAAQARRAAPTAREEPPHEGGLGGDADGVPGRHLDRSVHGDRDEGEGQHGREHAEYPAAAREQGSTGREADRPDADDPSVVGGSPDRSRPEETDGQEQQRETHS